MPQTRATPCASLLSPFPSLSNFIDLYALRSEPSVNLHLCRTAQGLTGADLILLSGSKQTSDCLFWMRSLRLDKAIAAYAVHGLRVGICGGMQMLGQTIADRDGTEHGGIIPGLGCLPLVQSCTRIKSQFRRSATSWAHHFCATGSTYLHGIFDDDAFRHLFLCSARSFHHLSASRFDLVATSTRAIARTAGRSSAEPSRSQGNLPLGGPGLAMPANLASQPVQRGGTPMIRRSVLTSAWLLDWIAGDPEWLSHPVRLVKLPLPAASAYYSDQPAATHTSWLRAAR